MAFSLFGRKEKPDPRRLREGMPVRIPDTTVRGPATATSRQDQRELARRTAEKIDQIESEMISGAGPVEATVPMSPLRAASFGAPLPSRNASFGAPMPSRNASTAQHALPQSGPAPTVKANGSAARSPDAVLPPLEFSTSILLGDTAAGFGGIQVTASALAPELEEAAILYANAQSQAAGATLRAAIDRGQLGVHARQAWLMFFDVLREMGARADFDSLALEYAARFEQSPPPWPERTAEPKPPADQGGAPTIVRFAARLDGAATRQIEQVRRAALGKRPVTVDFTAITEFDPDGVVLACSLLESFPSGGGELVVLGVAQLYEVARAAVEPGRRDASDSGWKLALTALRLLGDQQAFDDLSIEYCVTYEVSPPSWEPMPANVRGAADGAPAPREPRPARHDRDTSTVEGGAFVLHGEITGRIANELAALRDYAKTRSEVIVDCRGLRRLDFVAAGELLNEVVVLASQSKSVLFAEPMPIVEALLVVMGIHEVVEIRRRNI